MKLRFDRDRTRSFGRFLWQRFVDDKCFETAGALSYTTLVSLVPLMVAALAMFSAFPAFEGARDTLLDFVFHHFVPAAGRHVEEAMQGFAKNASQLTGISLLVMLFSAISMMVSIEDRLNRIWRVQTPRRWGSRLLLYWTALTLGPVLVVGGLAVSSYLTALPLLQGAAVQLGTEGRLLRLVPSTATFVTLWLMYVLIPNRHVSRRNAAIGALLGTLLFAIARWGFRLFVHGGHTYQQIYGALAAIPIFLAWIYLSWIIVILGASVAASASAFEYHPAAEKLPRGSELLGLLAVLRHCVDAQRAGRSVDPAELRVREPYLHSLAIATFFDDLHRAGLVQRNDAGGWLLARSLDSTDLRHLYAHCGYRLPLDPAREAAALGLSLPDELVALLESLAGTLDDALGMRLDQAYPAATSTVTEEPA
jgi:membrane protein